MPINREYRVPLLLFTLALLADHLITQRGLATGGREGNLVAIWLWQVLPIGPHMLAFLWWILVTNAAILLMRFSQFAGRWCLYWAFIGHLSGFLSWTPVLHTTVQRVWAVFGQRWGLVVLLMCAGMIGLFLAWVHKRITPQT
ncbi:MAG: hypothetical protein PHX87_04665 [Candidatus Peribacteraceae bacterium]|nr:hypothetical protein [Candidatus Peribacteraceae bacterium]MDD5742690.1 hypothetical protein [Candidatus Peribacteraceae bacterium]